MRFVIHPQHGVKQVSVIIWDAAGNAPLCEFVDGEFETEDKAVIAKLVDLGYEYEGFPVDVPDPQEPEDDEKALRDKAKELGIGNWHNKKLETLKEEIEKAGA